MTKAIRAAAAVSQPPRASAPSDAALVAVGVVLVSEPEALGVDGVVPVDEAVPVAAEVVILRKSPGKAKHAEPQLNCLPS